MNKYRPEKIQLTTPTQLAEEFAPILEEHLHKLAGLKREDKDDITVFSFKFKYIGSLPVNRSFETELNVPDNHDRVMYE